MRVLSVNIGRARLMSVKGRAVRSSICKDAVAQRVPVTTLGLAGDDRVEVRKMGPEHHAVYAYPQEHYAHWAQALQCADFPMGQFGENFTVQGLLETEVRIGDVLRIGGAVLQVTQPRLPCGKLNARMGFRFAPQFLASLRVGFYLRVLQEGEVGAGDAVALLSRDAHSPTVEAFVRTTQFEFWDATGLRQLLAARDLMPAWREAIEDKVLRAERAPGWLGLREFEVVARQDDGPGHVVLTLRCGRDRPLAPVEAGQCLMAVHEARSPQPQRLACPLVGGPPALGDYRILAARHGLELANEAAARLNAWLFGLMPGDRLLAEAPRAAPALSGIGAQRGLVLVSQGKGLALSLGLLRHLQARAGAPVRLFHVTVGEDPPALLAEVQRFRLALAAVGEGSMQPEGNGDALAEACLDADVFVAGSGRLIAQVTQWLQTRGVALPGGWTQPLV